jgi:hypothetical protein
VPVEQRGQVTATIVMSEGLAEVLLVSDRIAVIYEGRIVDVVPRDDATPAIPPRGSLTERARTEVCRQVGQDGDAVAAVARDFGVGWQTAMRAVIDRGEPLIDDAARLEG